MIKLTNRRCKIESWTAPRKSPKSCYCFPAPFFQRSTNRWAPSSSPVFANLPPPSRPRPKQCSCRQKAWWSFCNRCNLFRQRTLPSQFFPCLSWAADNLSWASNVPNFRRTYLGLLPRRFWSQPSNSSARHWIWTKCFCPVKRFWLKLKFVAIGFFFR